MKQSKLTWEEQTLDEIMEHHGDELVARIEAVKGAKVQDRHIQARLKEYLLRIRFTFWMQDKHQAKYKDLFDEFYKTLPKGAE